MNNRNNEKIGCPHCRNKKSKICSDGAYRGYPDTSIDAYIRWRACQKCGRRYPTKEIYFPEIDINKEE